VLPLLAGVVLHAGCGGSGRPADSDADGAGGFALDVNGGSGTAGDDASAGRSTETELELVVRAEQTEITASGEPVSVQLTAEFVDGSPPERVVWSVDDTRVGSVSDSGEFLINGYVAGTVTISASVGSLTASVTIEVTVDIVHNPDKLSASERDALITGGSDGPLGIGPDEQFRFLYPYDRTVFPRGLPGPVLQLGGEPASATYLSIESPGFSYQAFAKATGPTRILLPPEVWRGITLSAQASEWVEVSASKRSGEEVTGPVIQRWLMAPGSLKGAIYYNTYRSKLAGNNGAIMRIRPGETAEVLQSGCTVCHVVSASGSVMVAGVEWDGNNPAVSRAFNLRANGSIGLRNEQSEGRLYAFGGLTADGELLLTSGVPEAGAKMRGMSGKLASRLVETASGVSVEADGFDVEIAMTPNFAPDGSKVAFTNHDESAGGHVLSVMSFDGTASPVRFSDLINVVQDAEHVVAWPSFLPDSSAVLFHAGDSFDTALPKGGELRADIRLVDLETREVDPLLALNGFTEEGELYLPGGAEQEARLNYEPSVLPVPVGGYFWVLFTSRRTYGNVIAEGGSVARGGDIWGIPQAGETESPSPRKKIWIAAIDLEKTPGVDPSHPAFYLPGQELESGNMRAFAALSPCRDEGASCESAAECCDGFCRETERDAAGQPVLSCVAPPENGCSNTDEACAAASDCCDAEQACINRRCAAPPPPKPRVK
jgi:hypothetical protein